MPFPAAVPNREHQIVDPQFRASVLMFAWMQAVTGQFNAGFSGTIVTAKLTGAGVNGSMTFVNGVLTAQTAAT